MQCVAMARLLLLLVAAPAALALEDTDLLPHFHHGHHWKHEHATHKAAHGHSSRKLKLTAPHKSATVATEQSTPIQADSVATALKLSKLEVSAPVVTTTTLAPTTPSATKPATTLAPTTPAVTTPAPTTLAPVVEVPLVEPKEEDVDEVVEVQSVDRSSATAQIQVDLVEMRQNKAHISQLEQALHEDAALLRESSMLEHVSRSTRGRASAGRQVRQAAQLVKSTESMLRESRADVVERAQAMLHEATVTRDAADAISIEADEELKLFAGRQVSDEPARHESSAPKVQEKLTAEVSTKPKEASSQEDVDIEDEN